MILTREQIEDFIIANNESLARGIVLLPEDIQKKLKIFNDVISLVCNSHLQLLDLLEKKR